MLVFSTRIPVTPKMNEKDFILLCSEWVFNSPHYHKIVIDYNVEKHEDYEIQKENITCMISCYKDNIAEITAFRLKNIDGYKIWTIDIIFVSESEKKYIIVQNNLDSSSYNSSFPKSHKPNFIKVLMEKKMGEKNSFFEVVDSPLVCNDDSVNYCADFMNGNVNSTLPMVYISMDYDKYNVDYVRLSQWLSGMAYVVIEANKDISFKLKELTNSKNAHNGYIGIYYPGVDNYQLYSIADFRFGKVEAEISIIIQQSLIYQLPSSEYNWLQIQSLKSKEKLLKSTEASSQELNEFMLLSEQTENDLKEKIQILQKNNDALTAQLEALKAKHNNGIIRLQSGLYDFYTDEQYDFVLSVLNEVKGRIGDADTHNRRYEILDSIIENNTSTGEGKRISEELRKIFKPGFTWNASTKGKIKSLGFTISENGHNKIVFHDNKYMYTVASTPSEGRGILNLLSEIENGISITKKIL